MEKIKEERIQNPSAVDRAAIESKISNGYHVILQFDKPLYSPELLRRINNLCGEFGQKLEVRFYGHDGTFFDAAVAIHKSVRKFAETTASPPSSPVPV